MLDEEFLNDCTRYKDKRNRIIKNDLTYLKPVLMMNNNDNYSLLLLGLSIT